LSLLKTPRPFRASRHSAQEVKKGRPSKRKNGLANAPQASERRSRRSGGGAEARRAARSGSQQTQLTYIKRKIPLYEVLNEDGLELIERNCETVLQEIGIDFRDDAEALDMWRTAGADVKADRVRFPKGLVRSLIKSAPAEFTQHAHHRGLSQFREARLSRALNPPFRRHGVRASRRPRAQAPSRYGLQPFALFR
jgi:hypothetical protein